MGRLVTDLLEHLRHLMLVQHMDDVPASVPVTEETRERLLAQANQLGAHDVLRLIDLLALAQEEIREGTDPRLPLELALVKVTRPQADLSREALLLRLEQVEARVRTAPRAPATAPAPAAGVESAAPPAPAPPPEPASDEPPLDLAHLEQLWRQAVLPAVQERSIPIATMLGEARPVEVTGHRVVIEFPPSAAFHRSLAEEPKNAGLLAEVLHEVTGRRLTPAFAVGEAVPESTDEEGDDQPETEEDIVSLLKQTFDAREVSDE
jgi:DNA polymerase-3 subunit gamma/tau